MEFIDEAVVHVFAGKGGDGALSFRREKYIARGGPDGGNGGRGAHVLLRVDPSLNTLPLSIRKKVFRAPDGKPGMGKNRTGRAGQDLVLMVPRGTQVFEQPSGELLADLTTDGDVFTAAKGGYGGRGNRAFASPVNQTPREWEEGRPGQERVLRLELKLIADVGVVGLPNAGKSTLLRALSAARPRVAGYPFTTLTPNLGIVDAGDHRAFVMADVPGLIEGAHTGAGLGIRFLRHVERTTLLLHLVDLVPADGSDPAENYRIIRRELEGFSQTLAGKPEILAGSKADLPGAEQGLENLAHVTGQKPITVSALTRIRLGELVNILTKELEQRSAPAD